MPICSACIKGVAWELLILVLTRDYLVGSFQNAYLSVFQPKLVVILKGRGRGFEVDFHFLLFLIRENGSYQELFSE